MTGILRKEGNLHIDTTGRMPCEDWRYTSIKPKDVIDAKQPEAARRGEGLSQEYSE